MLLASCHVVGTHALDGVRCCQLSCCYNVFNVAGGPAVIPALFGILKHYTVKTIKLAEYDYRTNNFSAIGLSIFGTITWEYYWSLDYRTLESSYRTIDYRTPEKLSTPSSSIYT